MSIALSYLAWTLLLALAQVFIAAGAKRRQEGGLSWGLGNRDVQQTEYSGFASRMVRAQANLYESLPLFIGAVLLAHVAGRESAVTDWGARLFFWGRVLYIPAYGLGLVPWRTVIFGVATAGLVLVILSLV